MAQLSSINFSVTDEQLSQIDALIIQTGQTRSEWLQALVSRALNPVAPPAVLSLERIPPSAEGTPSKTMANARTPRSEAAPEPDVSPPLREEELNEVLHRFIEDDRPDEALHGFIDDTEDEPDEVLYGFLALSSESQPDGVSASALPPLPESIYDAEDEPDEILYDFLDEADRPF